MRGIAGTLAAHLVETPARAIPEAAWQAAKLGLLDTLAVMIGPHWVVGSEC